MLYLVQGYHLSNFTSTGLRSKRSLASDTKFKATFAELLQKDINATADKLEFLEFQRSACLLDLYKSTKRSVGTIRTKTGVKLGNVKTALALEVKQLFEQKDTADCRNCGTSIIKKYHKELLQDIDEIYDRIINGATQGSKGDELVDIQHDLGEAGYIMYKVFFQAENNGGINCTPMGVLSGLCDTDNIDINLGWFVFYSEHKFTLDASEKKSIKRLKKDIIKNFYRYHMIMRVVNQPSLEINMPEFVDSNKYASFLASIRVQSDCIRHGGLPENCLIPMCSEVIDAMEQCKTTSKNYVFLLDGSGSVASYDFDNMLKTVRSMVWMPMNGNNKVTIIEYSSSVRVRCNAVTDHSKIEECLFDSNQLRRGTNTHDGLNEAVKYMQDPNYDNILAVFTDGHATVKGKSLTDAVNSAKNYADILTFGIGQKFNKDELKMIGTSGEFTIVKDYSTFASKRFQYQKLICA